jgi:ABC-type amino acid transport substrate-binding protein
MKNIILIMASILLSIQSSANIDIFIANEGPEFSPFSFFENDNPYIKKGFEIDIVNELCNRLPTFINCHIIHRYENARTDYLNASNELKSSGLIDWGDLLTGLYKENPINYRYSWDVVISTIGIRDDRKKLYSFSNIYFKAIKYFVSTQTFIFDQENDNSVSKQELLSAIKGKTIGAEAGTALYDYALHLKKELSGGLKVVAFSSDTTQGGENAATKLAKALIAKQVDLSPQDLPVIMELKKKYPQLNPVGPELTTLKGGEVLGSGNVGIAFRKGSILVPYFNQSLAEILKDCTYANLHLKYFKTYGELTPKTCRSK